MVQQTGISIHPETGNVGIGIVNATSRLQVMGHITPSSCNVYDLGSSQLRFRDLYLSGSTIDLGGTKISRDAESGGITLASETGETVDSRVKNLVADGTITASNLNIVGDYVTMRTTTSNTEMMVIENAGTGPALKVTQTGANSIAEFYDDGGVLALKIADGGNVGIGTSTPLQKLHVIGTVQATGFSGSGALVTSLDATNISAGSLAVARGGTNIQSYTIGDIIYATGAAELSKLADVATGNALISGGVGVAPTWGKIGLTTHVSDTLGVGNGGTGAATLAANKLLVGNGAAQVLQPTNLHWDNTNSRLGISSSIPTSQLDIFKTTSGNTSDDMLGLIYDANWNLKIQQQHVGGSHIQYDIYQRFNATNIHTMTLKQGSVGIGITNPQAKLHVNGSFYSPGCVVQVKYFNYETTSVTTISGNSSFVQTPISLSITPKFSTSIIIVQAFVQLQVVSGGGGNGAYITLRRDNVAFAAGNYPEGSCLFYFNGTDNINLLFPYTRTFSATNTNSTTFTVYINGFSTTSSVRVNSTGISQLYVTEIAV
jgi:hypothetical protein